MVEIWRLDNPNSIEEGRGGVSSISDRERLKHQSIDRGNGIKDRARNGV